MSNEPVKSKGGILERIGFLLLVVALTTLTVTVITYPSSSCAGGCTIAAMYTTWNFMLTVVFSTLTYMLAGFMVLASLVLITAGRRLNRRLQAPE